MQKNDLTTPSEPLPKVLIVDDLPANLFALEQVLAPLDIEIIGARSGDEALKLMLRHDIALALLDAQMPGIDGFETASLMRQNPRTRHIPIIFVTAISKEDRYVFKGYEAGAVDYLFKPIEPHILRSKVQVFLELYRQKRELEQALHAQRQSRSDAERLAFALRGLVSAEREADIDPDEMSRRIRSFLDEEVLAVQPGGDDTTGIEFLGQRYALSGESRPLLESLLSAFEEVVRMGHKLRYARDELEREMTVREEAEREAREASEAKGKFLAWISHELRTPLNAIMGFSEILVNEADEQKLDWVRDDAEHIQAAALQLLQLIGNLLDVSKLEAGKMSVVIEEFEVCALIDEVSCIMSPLVRKNRNQLRIDAPEGLGVMCSDRLKLAQVLYNLLGNACKFTRDGVIELTAVRTSVNGVDSLVFCVKDTGVGIAAEALETLFDDFVQVEGASAQQQGSGLGLAITQSFCTLLRGRVSVDSAPEQGSTFTVTVPASLQGDHASPRLGSAG